MHEMQLIWGKIEPREFVIIRFNCNLLTRCRLKIRKSIWLIRRSHHSDANWGIPFVFRAIMRLFLLFLLIYLAIPVCISKQLPEKLFSTQVKRETEEEEKEDESSGDGTIQYFLFIQQWGGNFKKYFTSYVVHFILTPNRDEDHVQEEFSICMLSGLLGCCLRVWCVLRFPRFLCVIALPRISCVCCHLARGYGRVMSLVCTGQ